ncbi:MAG: ferrous iron transporter B, partial [Polyangiaceae bacterium]|nr:ferrous iron transporter B [Polyangiaceae bacterium]
MGAAVDARERTKLQPEAKRPTVTAEPRALVALVGNPNTGKTTLFNALTGERARVGNYPGVTVERRVGRLRLAPGGDAPARGRREIDVLDLPGTYSLSARSAEEQIALAGVLGLSGHPAPDLAVVVVDAGQLLRNLYLVLQLCELEVPLIVALNMIDEVAGGEPDVAALAKWLGAPVVATNARDGLGIDALRRAVAEALVAPHAPAPAFSVPYPAALRRDVEALRPFVLPLLAAAEPPAAARDAAAGRARGGPDVENDSRVQSPLSPTEPGVEADRGAAPVGRAGALALWALGSVDRDDELVDIDPTLRARALELQARAHADGRDLDAEIVATRYVLLDAEVPRLFARQAEPAAAEQPTEARHARTDKEGATTAAGDAMPPARRRSLPVLGARQAPPPASAKRRALTDRIDRVVLHPVVGFVVFVALMLLMFQALFSWSAPLVHLIEDAFGWLGAQTRAGLPAGFVSDLLVQGVIGGVGNVLVFLPQIILLFLFISVLED